MAKKRDTVTYNLKDGRTIVYKGTTNDPEQREQQHRDDGKRFTLLEVTSRRLTEESASERESAQLQQYRSNHGGQNPRYNKDTDG